MDNLENIKFYTHEEMLDKVLGEKGTPLRDAHEADVQTLLVGEAIKRTRLEQKLTQEELGMRIGVKKAQISKLEHGKSITLSTMGRVFRALGIPSAILDLGANGKVALW